MDLQGSLLKACGRGRVSDIQYTSNYGLKKPDGADTVKIDDLNYNADVLDQKLKEVEGKANSVNDAAIGARTPDQAQTPATPGTGTLTQLVSWLANRIKAITGKTNWWDAPDTTLAGAKGHMDAAAPHSGHETPAGAQAKVDAHANATSVHNATAAATANRIILRDASGRAKVAAPSVSDDIARKAEVDALESDLVVHRDGMATKEKVGHIKVGDNLSIDAEGKLSAPTPSDAIPSGIITMWSGLTTTIPTGWALCDGANGTPDLRDRFIVGAGSSYSVGATGGSASVTLTTAQMPSHSHGGSAYSAGGHGHGAGTLSASSAGSHQHSSGTLSTNTTGAHTHGYKDYSFSDSTPYAVESGTQLGYDIRELSRTTESNGAHSHTISGSVASAGDHSHTISGSIASAGDHSHSLSINSAGGGGAHENRPPYYALAFIMKL